MPQSEPAALGVAAATIPLAAIWLIRSARFGSLHRQLGIDRMRLPGLRPLLICFALYAVNLLILGAILQLLASAMTEGNEARFWLLTGVFAIAWVAGFLTPGAPGGLGVREAIMVALLGPVYDPGTALALAVTLRIVSTAGDGVGFVVGLLLRRYTNLR